MPKKNSEEEYENVRERLRLGIEEQERKSELKKEKELNEIKSFNEYLDESLYKICKRKSDGINLINFINFDNEKLVNEIPVTAIVKDNIYSKTVEDILELIKANNNKKFNNIKKYSASTKITKKYVDVFNYDIDFDLHTIKIKPDQKHRYPTSGSISKPNLDIDVIEKTLHLEHNNNILNFCNKYVKNINSFEVENNKDLLTTKSINTKSFLDIYNYLIKDIKSLVKKDTKNNTSCVRAIKIKKLILRHYLYPIYFIQCKKPGVDFRIAIDANTLKIIKD